MNASYRSSTGLDASQTSAAPRRHATDANPQSVAESEAKKYPEKKE